VVWVLRVWSHCRESSSRTSWQRPKKERHRHIGRAARETARFP
jgi:hypothetical protein